MVPRSGQLRMTRYGGASRYADRGISGGEGRISRKGQRNPGHVDTSGVSFGAGWSSWRLTAAGLFARQVAAYVAGEGTEREGSEEAELPPGPDPALVASNGAVPPEVVAAVTAAEREQAGLPKDPEPAGRGETCSITPEDAVWAAALASTAVEVDESSEAVSTNLVKLDQMRVGKVQPPHAHAHLPGVILCICPGGPWRTRFRLPDNTACN